jgi:hypothetical protein
MIVERVQAGLRRARAQGQEAGPAPSRCEGGSGNPPRARQGPRHPCRGARGRGWCGDGAASASRTGEDGVARLPARWGCSRRPICSAGSARTVRRAALPGRRPRPAPRRFSERERSGSSLSVPQKIFRPWRDLTIPMPTERPLFRRQAHLQAGCDTGSRGWRRQDCCRGDPNSGAAESWNSGLALTSQRGPARTTAEPRAALTPHHPKARLTPLSGRARHALSSLPA